MADYYNLLGVAPDASPDALRRAYRARAKAVHPDAHPHDDPARRTARKREFVALARAYETLRDPARRASYDRRLAGAGGSARSGRATRGRTAGGTTGRADRWRDTRSTFGGARRTTTDGTATGRASAGRATGDPAAPGGEPALDELLQDVERLLGRFGLDLRQPFDELLDALVAWAQQVFRQVLEAWEAAGEEEAPASTAQAPHRERASTRPAGGAAGAEAPPSAAGAARRGKAAGAASAEAALERDLRQLKERLRTGRGAGAGEEAALEAELRALKRRVARGE